MNACLQGGQTSIHIFIIGSIQGNFRGKLKNNPKIRR